MACMSSKLFQIDDTLLVCELARVWSASARCIAVGRGSDQTPSLLFAVRARDSKVSLFVG